MFQGLFSGKDLHEAPGEVIEVVGLGKVHMKRSGIELGKDVDLLKIRVDAVGYWNIDQPVFAPKGNSRFGPFLCQWKQPGTFSASQHNRQNIDHNQPPREGFLMWIKIL